ncbi:hypothetical protein MANES_03G036800v8 [Manihot esculenta]|uniref:Uncharacterized protein n=2 Tax=Manihot esculenta TaxID=3983 RepID=A0ACB7HWN0_MANES|nr:hypothetical protein MANES_03G036800v8 [Manihot esculenta]KAG8657074.1 hypothetical protein MANES_03G036800v8 [Manihot esculenta]
MATSSKFDLSSDSPERPSYTSGQRGGSHLTAQLDRSAQGDVVNFFQCLRFDPKAVVADHKSNRKGDFKRHLNVALGISLDDPPSIPLKGKVPAPEEIKRVKAGLRESSVRARERMKIFNESLSVFNKFFPSIPSKKRSRSEGFSSDRPNALLSSDRSVLGPSLGKMGIHNHAVSGGGFELEQQKSEERTKNVVPNKRTRTSLVDVRSNSLVRPSGTVDREREMLRLASSGAVQGDDRILSIGVDGWEKTKMKKKRSVIKPDVSPSLASTKPNDGYQKPKQGMQQKPATEARSRLNSDSDGFRPGVANGAVSIGKSDGISQSAGLSIRPSIPRADLDNGSLLNDRRERPVGSDKERMNIRAVNKANVRDDFNSASPTSSTKMNAPVRAPRSGSGIAPKLSPVVHRATASNEWELSHCSSKPPTTVGMSNRKRTASARSSSPPVAHWAGQRPQKSSRSARRTNLIPIVSNNDESATLDTVSDVSGELGFGFAKRLTGNSPQQVKLKNEPVSSAALSESEESGAPEIKSKDRGKKSDDIDEKAGLNVQKVSNLGLPSRKNKLVTGEDLGDGVRRQGRTGRGFTTRAHMPMSVEKVGNVRTAKQLRSARLSFDKNESSKTGRPPTRKLSDRKAYKRQKHTTVSAAADFLVGSEDGHEELLAAASAVTNPAHACSNSFWRQMEPFFGFISDADIDLLKKQEIIESAAPPPARVSFDVNNCSTVPNGYGLIEREGEVRLSTESRVCEPLVPGASDIPLYLRLLAAIISEEDFTHGNRDLEFDTYETGFELDRELGSNGLSHADNFKFSGHTPFNGYKMALKTEHDEAEIDALGISSTSIYSNFDDSVNGALSDQGLIPGMVCSEFQYDDMQINEKLLLEVQSVGIFPESMPDMQMEDDGISGEILSLEDKYHGQVSKKKGLLDKLLKSVSGAKELQEKEFEERAHDKLVAMAYEKYMACCCPSAGGGKSSSNKMAKQAALAFVKRTLERCHKFEDTGKSCFSEPLFRDMFLPRSSHLSGGRSSGTPVDEESGKLYANTSSRSLEARVSGSLGSQPSPRTSRLSQNGDGYVANSSDLLPPVNRLSEQSAGKEDTWSNKVKKRELLLDDVGGTIGASSVPSGIGGSLSSSTKGKRSERDREGKGHNGGVLSRNGTNKIGRPALSNIKGERKSKTKPKQKTQLSVSVNGLLGKITEQPKPALHSQAKSGDITVCRNGNEKDGFGLDVLDDPESIDLSNLQLPGLDDGQGQDLGSWLNIDDDGLQDHGDFMGLEIPMDDLSDLNMMV